MVIVPEPLAQFSPLHLSFMVGAYCLLVSHFGLMVLIRIGPGVVSG